MRSAREMLFGDGLFLRTHRQQKHLSTHLQSQYGHSAIAKAKALTEEQLTTSTSDLVAEIVQELALTPPSLGSWFQGSIQSAGHRPGPQREIMVPVFRKYASIQVSGEASLLQWWPDEAEGNLVEIDPWELGPDPWRDYDTPYDEASSIEWYRRLEARKLWTLNYESDEDRRVRLYTFVDLTNSELDDVAAGVLDVQSMFERARAYIAPIVEAIATQTSRFLEHDLVSSLTAVIEDRRRYLSNRDALTRQLGWPTTWKQAEPKLVEQQDRSEMQSTPKVEAEVERFFDEAVQILELRHKYRLAPASFTDVQRTIRVWVDAVQRYPRSFTSLSEDQLSDLLAATLNAALPGAQREVYRRSGKSDIFVSADVLAAGTGPEKVFVAECKKWRGGQGVANGFDQLLGYLTSGDLAAILIVFNATLSSQEADAKSLEALQAEPGYTSTELSGPAGWPILTFEQIGRPRLDLCLVVVTMDPKRLRTNRRSR